MSYLSLLTSQKQDLFDIAKQEGFNPSDFRLIPKGEIPVLQFRDGDYFIEFFLHDNTFKKGVKYCPGRDKQIDEPSSYFNTWKDYTEQFKLWLNYLKRELNADENWNKLLLNFDTAFSQSNFMSEVKFTQIEIEIIKEKFQLIKQELPTIGISSDSLDAINKKLDHIVELSENLSKTDWFEILMGSLMGTVFSMLLTMDNVKSIWKIIGHHFSNWLTLPMYPGV